jgi:putative nucleotidyltransferase with HDIG domain
MTKSSGLQRVWSWVRSPSARRWLALITVSLGTAALLMKYAPQSTADLGVGDVADRSVKAHSGFPFKDWEATLGRQRKAEAGVQPVFDFDATLAARINARLDGAFETGRIRHAEALAKDPAGVSPEVLAGISADFVTLLDFSLGPGALRRIEAAAWSVEIEQTSKSLIFSALSRFIIADKALLPSPPRSLTVIRRLQNSRDEKELDDYQLIRSPDESRQAIQMAASDPTGPQVNRETLRAAVAIAQAAVRPNFSYNQLITEDARRDAREAVSEVIIQIKRGTALVREGDVVNQSQFELLAAQQQSRGRSTKGVFVALIAFSALIFVSLYVFAAGFIKKFSTLPRDLEATAFLTLLVLVLGRLAVEVATPLSLASGIELSEGGIWYMVPVAGGAMLTRILVNSETALIWTLCTSVLLGLMMDQQVLYMVYFMVSGLTAAGGIAHTKERVNVLRAGFLTGLVNAACVVLIGLFQVHMVDSAEGGASGPLWDMCFAFLGGNLSAVLVLGLVPMFELFGFTTDYKLLELANLNHPLLKNLMLAAPGTYHHSVIVGSLAESAAESIGCNALQTRVSCYFHDVGKAAKPSYFIENLRDAPNPHDRLAPHQSARIIINHVLDGAAIAKQYKLPAPIIDGIMMHHGTGIIQYFYAKALEEAGPGVEVDPADYRYPGKLPDTREAGIIFLADRVEAACRTLQDPTQETIRAMIQKLVNSAVMDGQLELCPLTIRELYTIVDAFTNTLLGIYHHRIEYPGLPVQPPSSDQVPAQGIITLDVASPMGEEKAADQAPGRPPAEA